MKPDIPAAPVGSLCLVKIHKLIARARLLPPPSKIPKPFKRVKIGNGYDVYCAISHHQNPPKLTYFLRKRIKGLRYYLVMADSWEMMLEHMTW